MTHEVVNQVPPLTGHDVADEAVLLDGLAREGAGWAEAEVRELGRLAGTEHAQEQGRLANENPPVLRTHDRYGNRIDEVEFHPAWHELMNVAVTHGLHGSAWADPREGAHVARAAKFYTWRVDAGHGCPTVAWSETHHFPQRSSKARMVNGDHVHFMQCADAVANASPV